MLEFPYTVEMMIPAFRMKDECACRCVDGVAITEVIDICYGLSMNWDLP